MGNQNVRSIRIRLPFDIDVYLAPKEPLFSPDGDLSQEAVDWLSGLAQNFAIFEMTPHWEPDSLAYFVGVRTRNKPTGEGTMAAADDYSEFRGGHGLFDIGPEDHDSREDPLICKFWPVHTGQPDGPKFYLSDFQGDGSRAISKLLLAVHLLSLDHPDI